MINHNSDTVTLCRFVWISNAEPISCAVISLWKKSFMHIFFSLHRSLFISSIAKTGIVSLVVERQFISVWHCHVFVLCNCFNQFGNHSCILTSSYVLKQCTSNYWFCSFLVYCDPIALRCELMISHWSLILPIYVVQQTTAKYIKLYWYIFWLWTTPPPPPPFFFF